MPTATATKDRWTRGTVHSLFPDTDTWPRVWFTRDYNGYINGNIALYKDDHGEWNIQHHPSGWHVGKFDRKRDAQAAVATLRTEFDFTFMDRWAENQSAHSPQSAEDWETGNAFRQRFHELVRDSDLR